MAALTQISPNHPPLRVSGTLYGLPEIKKSGVGMKKYSEFEGSETLFELTEAESLTNNSGDYTRGSRPASAAVPPGGTPSASPPDTFRSVFSPLPSFRNGSNPTLKDFGLSRIEPTYESLLALQKK